MQARRFNAALVAAPVLGLLTAACAEQPKDPAQQAREDARAVAMVEAAQDAKPPPTPMEPQPITAADIEANKFYGVGCNLVPAGQPGGNPIVIANDRRAVLKVGGKFVTFAADPGSAALAMGTRSRYVGKAQSLDLNRSPSDGTRLGQEASRWSAGMVVRDAWGQMIYSSGGELICGS